MASIKKIFRDQKQQCMKTSASSVKERRNRLLTLRRIILKYRQRIGDAVYKDLGKPRAETDLWEVFVVLQEIDHTSRRLKRWMKPRKVRRTLAMISTKAWFRYTAKGVVLIISPWNFPFMLAIGPLVSAIAAGNCAIIKPSELAPNTSRVIAEMIGEAFSESNVAVVLGDHTVAADLLDNPFDHVFFTGSTAVGKKIMEKAARHLSSVTLELGGKNAAIIDAACDINEAARKISWGKFSNCGQTCVAPDYVLVHKDIYDPFIAKLKWHVTRMYGSSDEEIQKNGHYARIINNTHVSRLAELIDEAVKQGAGLEAGGTIRADDKFVAPTILSGPLLGTTLMEQEIFGPVLPVIPYNDLEEAVSLIGKNPRPLALYIFSNNKNHITYAADNTASGGIGINEVLIQFTHLNLPFGGLNESGIGSAHGFYGFSEFSNTRSFLKRSGMNLLGQVYPPFTARVKRLVELMIRYL